MNFTLPVSVKGIIINSNRQVLLMKNERDFWELPGGRLEPNEQPEETVKREIKEEANLEVSVQVLVDSWVYEVLKDRFVFKVAYHCDFNEQQEIILSDEHIDFAWFHFEDLKNIKIDDGYRKAIKKLGTMH